MGKEDIGQRGKEAEKLVERVLKSMNGYSEFSYFRLADARAALGRLAAQPGDFCYFCNGFAGIIEVKATQHDYRLAKDKLSQLPTLHKLALAGARSLLIIHHSTADVWRTVPPEDLPLGQASWDLTPYLTYDCVEHALLESGYFK